MKIMQEYGEYFVSLSQKFIHLDIIYIVIIVLSMLTSYILVSVFSAKALIVMNKKAGSLVWIPFINILYLLTKGVHSLFAVIYVLLLLLIIPLPHPVHGVWTISSIVSNSATRILFFISIIEIIIGMITFVINYIKYDRSMKVVK